MSRIEYGHYHEQGIDYAIFFADATTPSDSARGEVLTRLTHKARLTDKKVDKSVLAQPQGSGWHFWGTPDLVQYLVGLANSGFVPTPTHWIDD